MGGAIYANKLIDLDWMGKSGVDTYPVDVNETLMWHEAVARGCPMHIDHDNVLVDYSLAVTRGMEAADGKGK
jgi:hypothetical protein